MNANFLVSRRGLGLLGCSLVLPLAAPLSASANDQGTPPEAETLVKKAIAFIKANGADKAYDEISNGKTFKDRDLHVIVYTLDGKNLAHGANGRMVGKDLIDLKDPDGKPIIKMFADIARSKGKGWSEDYKFMNPVSKKMETKTTYIERLGDTFIGCGVYKG